MKYEIVKVYEGRLIDNEKPLTMIQVCDRCRVIPQEIMDMIEEGMIQPGHRRGKSIRFSLDALERIQKIRRLRSELELSLAGTALAIQLLDRIEELELKLKYHRRQEV